MDGIWLGADDLMRQDDINVLSGFKVEERTGTAENLRLVPECMCKPLVNRPT